MTTTPAYVHDLLDAFLSGEPLNFKQHPVPADIQQRLTKAKDAGILQGIPEREEEEPA